MLLSHHLRTLGRLKILTSALAIQWPILLGACTGDLGLDGPETPLLSQGPLEDAKKCISCHGSPQGARRAAVDPDGGGSHVPWVPPGQPPADTDCEVCHEMTRHLQGRVRLWSDPLNRSAAFVLEGDPAMAPSEADKVIQLCEACHSKSQHSVHAVAGPWRPACTACHNVHDPNGTNKSMISSVVRHALLGVDKTVHLNARTGVGGFSDGAGGNDGICQVCHTATAFHRQDGGGIAHQEGADCLRCHTHANGFIPIGVTSCVGCHSLQQGSRPAVVTDDGTGGHHLGGGRLADGDCIRCHDMSRHRQGEVRLWANPESPSTSIAASGDPGQLVGFCTSCHGGANPPTVHHTGTAYQPACTECHEIHDPANANLSLMADAVRSTALGIDKAVVFTARSGAGSFSDGGGGRDGICQVCHTATAYHLHTSTTAVHNAGADCTACHTHALGFIPVGGTSCVGCHSEAQGPRRPVVNEFGLASHHVQGAGVTDTDCLVCHDMSEHQRGRVRLKDVDDPGNPAAVISLDDDPATNPVDAAKLEPFCLACHDEDGAGGSAPFSNGILPTPIDAALWDTASHGAGQMTCMGDGESFGCHGTGHGSAKRVLLAPPDGSQPPLAGDPLRQEEGMCYACHDSDGPASSDVFSQFALTSHHKVSAAEQDDGARVECTDCHDPHAARSTALLSDPDSGGTWSGTLAAFCMVCHDGAPPEGVIFPEVSSGTGYDKSSFAGSTHAVELGAESCAHCHEHHGSAFPSLLQNTYVIADNNPYEAADYAACWACHDPDVTISGTNAFEDLHKEHVDEEETSCIVCHDVHAPADAGEAGLVNFAFALDNGYDIVLRARLIPYTTSTAFYIDATPPEMGFCLLECHDKEHAPKNYERTPGPAVDCSACHDQ